MALLVEERTKARVRDCATTGWFAERFAREKALRPLPKYLGEGEPVEVDQAEVMRAWALANDRRKGGLAARRQGE